MSVKIDNRNVTNVTANGVLKAINGNTVVVEDVKTGEQDVLDINFHLQQFIDREVKITINNKEVLDFTTD
ncbi:MAG: hypothetical protein ACM3O3_12865 [Syntrophothermus sp.]